MGPDLGHHRNTALKQENLWGAERDRQESKLHIVVRTGDAQSSTPAEESGRVALHQVWGWGADFLRSGLENYVGFLEVWKCHPCWEGVSPFRPLPLRCSDGHPGAGRARRARRVGSFCNPNKIVIN